MPQSAAAPDVLALALQEVLVLALELEILVLALKAMEDTDLLEFAAIPILHIASLAV